MEKLGEVLLIDHHPFFCDFNGKNIVFFNAEGYCAAYLCYNLFSKIKNLENYDWLVACACISDWCYKKNKEWMEKVFEKYGEKFRGGAAEGVEDGKIIEIMKILCMAVIYFKSNLRKVFDKIGSTFGDIEDLAKHAKEVQKEIDSCVEKFEREKEKINGGYFWEFEKGKFNIKSLAANAVSLKHFDKTILILEDDDKICKISARRQNKGEDMNELLKKLVDGFENAFAGGHVAASGGYFLSKDREKFIKRVREM